MDEHAATDCRPPQGCAICGGYLPPVKGGRTRVTCSSYCKYRLKRDRWKAREAAGEPRRPATSRAAKHYECLFCGIDFVRKRYPSGAYSRQTKYCTRECAFAHKSADNPSRPPDNRKKLTCRRKGDIRRHRGRGGIRLRCRHYGVKYLPISRHEILEHGGWTCAICGRELLRKHTKYGWKVDPLSPTVDHIIPLSLGPGISPGHVWGNVQAACWECNTRKGADPDFKCD